MKLIGTQLIIESGGVLIADFVDIEVNKLIVDQSGKIHANGKVISFPNFFFHSFFFLNLTHFKYLSVLMRKFKLLSYRKQTLKYSEICLNPSLNGITHRPNYK
jgi:hypothetical protein